jgi:hypothetical protein
MLSRRGFLGALAGVAGAVLTGAASSLRMLPEPVKAKRWIVGFDFADGESVTITSMLDVANGDWYHFTGKNWELIGRSPGWQASNI